MQIERTKDEIIVRLPAGTDVTRLQRLLDYLKFTEITSQSKATQEEINNIARESKASWWKENKNKFIE